MLRAFLLVGMGGAIGSMARYGVGILTAKLISHPYPFATFLINITGCFLIGLLFGYAQKQQLTPEWWLIAATGFCGGFTTFSSFALENMNLVKEGQSTLSVIYLILSISIGLLLCKWGISLVRY